jgi:hypothetical protein
MPLRRTESGRPLTGKFFFAATEEKSLTAELRRCIASPSRCRTAVALPHLPQRARNRQRGRRMDSALVLPVVPSPTGVDICRLARFFQRPSSGSGSRAEHARRPCLRSLQITVNRITVLPANAGDILKENRRLEPVFSFMTE